MPIETLDPNLDPAATLRVALVVARYNRYITDALVSGATDAFSARLDPSKHALTIIPAAGAFEIPTLTSAAIDSGYDAVVCLGCIIKGETAHDHHLATAVTQALADLSIALPIPIGLGVLTVDSSEQAEARAGGALGNKGAEAMDAALDTLAAIQSLSNQPGANS
jgi:6,7-dimethyl-8-ribityllumazine synthase